MEDAAEKVTAAGAGAAGWLAGLPAGLIVVVVVSAAVITMCGRWALAREETRRERIRWAGAAEVYRSGGDGANVASGLTMHSSCCRRHVDDHAGPQPD